MLGVRETETFEGSRNPPLPDWFAADNVTGMSYHDAKKAFLDIKNYVTSKSDPVHFDLSSGLHALTEALERDSQEIKDRLDELERRIKQGR